MLYGNEVAPKLSLDIIKLDSGRLVFYISLAHTSRDGSIVSSNIQVDIKDPMETMQAMQTLTESLRDFIPGGTPND